MHRTTVMLPEELKSRAEFRARSEGISLGELIRRALAAMVAAPPPSRADDPLFADTEVYRGVAPDSIAAEHDRYLYGSDE